MASIRLVRDFEVDLSETVPYIGATEVHDLGFDGTGVTVAVLDSGIDYMHAEFGGSGDRGRLRRQRPVHHRGRAPSPRRRSSAATTSWAATGTAPAGPAESPDPDPLDDGPGGGHGTHVADIIGGLSGVAPGVSLYAVKVCSSVSTACSGIALIEGMDFALDPNGDGSVADHVDVINMSLGSDYGTARDDDLSQAVEHATAVGTLTVASAGNGADKPYVVGTPSVAPTALSVAQTAVPSAIQVLMEVTAPAGIADLYAAVFQPWSAPLTTMLEGYVQYGDGAGGHLNGCSTDPTGNSTDPADAPFAPGSLTGKIVLVDRGCATSASRSTTSSRAAASSGSSA